MNLGDFLVFPFLQYAFIGILGLGLTAGVLSPYVVGKKYSFLGAAIGHSTLLGLSLSAWLFPLLGLAGHEFLGTILWTLLMVLFLGKATYNQELPADSLIGLFLTTSMALGLIIGQLFLKGGNSLLHFLFGNILLLNPADAAILVALSFFTVFIFYRYRDYWTLFTFDETEAIISQLPVKRLHYGLLILISLVIVLGVKLAGTLLVSSLLITPGLFALSLANNRRRTFILAISFSLGTSLLGLFLGNALGLPVGPSICIIQFVCLLPKSIGARLKSS